jgi:hypothetical protein
VAPAPREVRQVPGAWRGGPDTEVGKAIAGMRERLRAADSQLNVRFEGDSMESLFNRAILDNRGVTNAQLLAMGNVKLEQLATPEADRQWVERRFPNSRQLDEHKFTVGLLSAATGLDAEKLSAAAPDLGLVGSAGRRVLWQADNDAHRRSTALHDFTDFLRGAGIEGLNRAVWGDESSTGSALTSYRNRGPVLGAQR